MLDEVKSVEVRLRFHARIVIPKLLMIYLEVEPTVLLLLNNRLQSLLQLLDSHILPVDSLSLSLSQLLRRDQDITYNVQDTVLSNAVTHHDVRESVNSDVDETAVAGNVDVQLFAFEHSRQAYLEEALGDARPAARSTGTVVLTTVHHATHAVAVALEKFLLAITGLVVSVGVESVALADDVVEEESLEVLLAVRAEEEGVDARSELLEGEVAGGEEGAAGVGAVELVEEAGLL